MLACKADLEKLQYPVLVTPKLDGIRCTVSHLGVCSRTGKQIPNKHIQKMMKDLPFLDGELMVEGDFNEVQSAVMKVDGTPDFTYCVFDIPLKYDGYGYHERVRILMESDLPSFVQVLVPVWVDNEEQILQQHKKYLQEGYEGTMIRKPDGEYKYGRSTVKEGLLLKLKDFQDAEALLVDVVEKMHNGNDLERNELGYAKRSSKKENLYPAGTAGSLVLNWNGVEFSVGFGPGITDKIKQEIWDNRETLKGKWVKFSYQELSKDGVPRFGKFLCFRDVEDFDLNGDS